MPRKSVNITMDEYYKLVKAKEEYEELLEILNIDKEGIKEIIKGAKLGKAQGGYMQDVSGRDIGVM